MTEDAIKEAMQLIEDSLNMDDLNNQNLNIDNLIMESLNKDQNLLTVPEKIIDNEPSPNKDETTKIQDLKVPNVDIKKEIIKREESIQKEESILKEKSVEKTESIEKTDTMPKIETIKKSESVQKVEYFEKENAVGTNKEEEMSKSKPTIQSLEE